MRFPVNNSDALKIGIPAPLRQVMGMTDPVSIHRTFVANFTTRHENNLLNGINEEYSKVPVIRGGKWGEWGKCSMFTVQRSIVI